MQKSYSLSSKRYPILNYAKLHVFHSETKVQKRWLIKKNRLAKTYFPTCFSVSVICKRKSAETPEHNDWGSSWRYCDKCAFVRLCRSCRLAEHGSSLNSVCRLTYWFGQWLEKVWQDFKKLSARDVTQTPVALLNTSYLAWRLCSPLW